MLRIRTTGEEAPAPRIPNPYVRAIAANWMIAADEEALLPGGRSHAEIVASVTDLPDFLAVLVDLLGAPPRHPRVLVIDQFEELFTFAPEHWQHRAGFFVELSAALDADPDLSVLLAMREDYIFRTDPFAGQVSNHLQQRFRIETLRESQAR